MLPFSNLTFGSQETHLFLKNEKAINTSSYALKRGSLIYIFIVIFLLVFLCLWILRLVWSLLYSRYMLHDEENLQDQHEFQSVIQTAPNYADLPNRMLQPRGPYIYRSSFRSSCRRYSV